MVKVSDVVAVLDAMYPPSWAEDWDVVGTCVGDPEASVDTILFAVDPVQSVVDEAIALGAQLIVTHHPLYLKGVTSVAATAPKGKVVQALAGHGIALHTCHTNADCAPLGVSESLAFALGLVDLRPLAPDAADPLDQWHVYVPQVAADAVAAAAHEAGAGRIGNYDRAQFRTEGRGSFRPLDGAQPALGQIGEVAWVQETRLEFVAAAHSREVIRAAVLAAHPYEEVAYGVSALMTEPSERGSGRIGRLPEPMTLGEFATHVRASLPTHHGATRIAGDLDRQISTVAVCGGSGDFLLGTASAVGADVYVTSDLRHHPVSEHQEAPGACAVIDVPHWAAESTWLPVAARALTERMGGRVTTHVSTRCTDPWSHTLGAQ